MPVGVSCATVFLWILWLFGTGVATFSFPFPNVSNGYVAAWVAFAAANRLAYVHTCNMPGPLEKLWKAGGGFVEVCDGRGPLSAPSLARALARSLGDEA